MEIAQLFEGREYPLTLYNGAPLIDKGFQFVYNDCGTETDFDFPDYESSYIVVYNERLGREIKRIALTRNQNLLLFYSTDTVFEDNGDYYYEVIYVQSGGYEIVLRYGTIKII